MFLCLFLSLPLYFCLYILSRSAVSPGLEHVALCSRHPVGPVAQYPLVTVWLAVTVVGALVDGPATTARAGATLVGCQSWLRLPAMCNRMGVTLEGCLPGCVGWTGQVCRETPGQGEQS